MEVVRRMQSMRLPSAIEKGNNARAEAALRRGAYPNRPITIVDDEERRLMLPLDAAILKGRTRIAAAIQSYGGEEHDVLTSKAILEAIEKLKVAIIGVSPAGRDDGGYRITLASTNKFDSALLNVTVRPEPGSKEDSDIREISQEIAARRHSELNDFKRSA